MNDAVRRGYLCRNPAVVGKGTAAELVDHEIEPFTVDEVQLLLKTAMDRRDGVRWAIALALGLRQVEARPQVVRCRLGGGKSDGSTGSPPATFAREWAPGIVAARSVVNARCVSQHVRNHSGLLPSAGLRDARLHGAGHAARRPCC